MKAKPTRLLIQFISSKNILLHRFPIKPLIETHIIVFYSQNRFYFHGPSWYFFFWTKAPLIRTIRTDTQNNTLAFEFKLVGSGLSWFIIILPIFLVIWGFSPSSPQPHQSQSTACGWWAPVVSRVYHHSHHIFFHWIGLRENLQETMGFTIKYRAFL